MSGAAERDGVAPGSDRERRALLDRFAAAYSGTEPPEAALRRALDPDRLDPSDTGTVWGREAALRRRLYRRGTTAEEAAEHGRLADAVAVEDAAARAALLAARRRRPADPEPSGAGPLAPAGPPRTGRRRVLVPVAAATVLLAVVIAVIASGRDEPGTLPERPVVVGRQLALRGTPAQVERLRAAVRGGAQDADALITRTVIHDVAALRDATRLSEEDATGSGSASLTVPDVDAFHRQRTATVLLFCATPAAWTWTLEGTVGRGGAARTWRQRGRGSDCGRLSVATVPLPAGLHETTLVARAEHRAPLVAVLETVG